MITKKIKNKLLKYYSDEGKERVGFITKKGNIAEVENICNDPENGFVVSTEDIINYAEDKESIATWHTHPNQSCNLSGEDSKMFYQWPDMFHIIIGKDGLNVYTVDSTGTLIVV
jgi:proteasome lid subunit RPN8/RPN11